MKVPVKGMYFLDGGMLTFNKSLMTYRHGFNKFVDIPVVPVLIDTDDGYVLYDTGVDPYGLESIEAWEDKKDYIKEFKEENDIRVQLKKIGVSPNDIKYVINSHFHWDHTGGNRF